MQSQLRMGRSRAARWWRTAGLGTVPTVRPRRPTATCRMTCGCLRRVGHGRTAPPWLGARRAALRLLGEGRWSCRGLTHAPCPRRTCPWCPLCRCHPWCRRCTGTRLTASPNRLAATCEDFWSPAR